MTSSAYDVWYDANEVDEANRAHVLRSWFRPGVELAIGKIILAGDDEVPPVFARVLSYDDATEIATLELIFDPAHAAVA